MRVGSGEHTYEWIEDWATIPDSELGRESGRTQGVAVTSDQRILVFHEGNPALLVFDADGTLLDAWGDRFPGAHGLTLVHEDDNDYLWLADFKTGEVSKTTLNGDVVMSLPRPDLAVYREGGRYAPTWISVYEERFGGNGDIWLADGYGSWYVHRFSKHGDYLGSINGAEGRTGAFRQPHAAWVDTRKAEPELYISDRFHRRIQVYDLDGHYKRVFGEDVANSACMFLPVGDWLVVPEAPYRARLTILDHDDRLVTTLGVNDAVCTTEGFPNSRELVAPAKFNSPHSVAADAQGNLYVVDWITGGRITKLEKV